MEPNQNEQDEIQFIQIEIPYFQSLYLENLTQYSDFQVNPRDKSCGRNPRYLGRNYVRIPGVPRRGMFRLGIGAFLKGAKILK